MAATDIEWQWKCNQQGSTRDCQLHVKQRTEWEKQRDRERGLRLDLPDAWQKATKGKWSKLLWARTQQKRTPKCRQSRKIMLCTNQHLSHFGFLLLEENTFLPRKPKYATYASFLVQFFLSRLYWFYARKCQKNFASISCKLCFILRLQLASKCYSFRKPNNIISEPSTLYFLMIWNQSKTITMLR